MIHIHRDSPLPRSASTAKPTDPVNLSDTSAHPHEEGAATGQPNITVTIPSLHSSRPAAIPLRSIPTSLHRLDDHSAPLLETNDEKAEPRPSSDSAGSGFSLWSDTGDLAEQLADEEDPLRIRLRDSLDEEVFGGSAARARGRQPKRVRYLQQTHLERKITNPGVDKEAIEIPNPAPRRISRAEKALATIMTGDRAASQMHGLTGKPLLYAYTTARIPCVDADRT